LAPRTRPRQYWFPSLVPWLIISLSGCQTWATLPTPAPGQQFEGAPDRIDVVRTDGSSLTLDYPVVVGDSLVGFVRERQHATRVAVLLSDLRLVETENFSAARTIGLLLCLSPAVIYFWLLRSLPKEF
jgi:hypothetical protein